MRSFILCVCICLGVSATTSAQFMFNVKRTFRETNHQILKSSYSSTGNYIITSGSDNSIIIWNTESGIIYRTIAGLRKKPNTYFLFEDKGLFFSGGKDNVITVRDLTTQEIIAVFEGHRDVIKTIDVSPDGKYLASGSSDKTIRVWEISSKNLVYELKDHKKDVNSVQFSPDGKILASGGADKKLILWSMVNGHIIRSEEAHDGWIRDLTFSHDGKTIATCGDDKLIKTWNVNDLAKINSFAGHTDWVQTIDFTPNSKNMISGGHDRRIILWEVSTGKVLFRSEKQEQIVLSVDINPNRSDFISSSLLVEDLKIWALAGLDGSQWRKSTETELFQQEIALIENPGKEIKEIETLGEDLTSEIVAGYSPIEVFSPDLSAKKVVHNDRYIYILGRVNDSEGINTFLINRDVVKLSEGGTFEYRMNLTRGDNLVELVSINNKGKMSKESLVIDCTDPLASLEPSWKLEIERGKYYALLIGINDYQDLKINDLENPVSDAEDLYNILVSEYTFDKENVTILKNPVRKEIIIALDELGMKLSENDNLLIFYAGHGYWDKKGKVGYWFPSNANRSNSANWLRNSTLRDFIGSIQTRHTILIADACFSGAIFKTRAAFTQTASEGIQKLYEMPSRKAITSGVLEEVPDESIFIKYLIRRLEANDKKYLPSELLYSNLKAIVINNSPIIPQYGTIQNVGDEGGDFIFVRRD